MTLPNMSLMLMRAPLPNMPLTLQRPLTLSNMSLMLKRPLTLPMMPLSLPIMQLRASGPLPKKQPGRLQKLSRIPTLQVPEGR